MRLFLRRSLEALRRGEFARVLFCYGFGERQPALALERLAGDRGDLGLTVVGDGMPERLAGRQPRRPRRGGRRVSKNQARQAIAAGPLAAQLHSHLAELPVELLRLLVTDADRTLTELRAAPANA